jgi:hypothetical protein
MVEIGRREFVFTIGAATAYALFHAARQFTEHQKCTV